jgi:hypothetical protein
MSTRSTSGGIKGFFQRAYSSFGKGLQFSRDWSWWLAQKGGTVGLALASTSMIVLMPLIFEINREVMVCPLHCQGFLYRNCYFYYKFVIHPFLLPF